MRQYKKAFLALLVIFAICFSLQIESLAHEIFYKGSSPNWIPIPLVWDERDLSGGPYLKMNGDYLSSDYSSYYVTASNAWPNASSKVSVVRTSFSSSKVDLATATETYWDNRWGYLYAHNYLGVCDMWSTDGKALTDPSSAEASSGRIGYASILFTPYIGDYDWSLFDSNVRPNHIKATMVHEIGHSLGLGHPNTYYYVTSAASIMRTGTGYEGYYTPQAHDINDLSSKY